MAVVVVMKQYLGNISNIPADLARVASRPVQKKQVVIHRLWIRVSLHLHPVFIEERSAIRNYLHRAAGAPSAKSASAGHAPARRRRPLEVRAHLAKSRFTNFFMNRAARAPAPGPSVLFEKVDEAAAALGKGQSAATAAA